MKRFWDKVRKTDGCWLWTAAAGSNGYGRFKLDGRLECAHRVAWQLVHGDIPEGMFVCHTCDNPACVNPAHLFLGTRSDNMRDAYRKGRLHLPRGTPPVVYGEECSSSKLTVADVRAIRERYAAGKATGPRLAEEYGVHYQTIYDVIHRKTWAHVD